MSVPTRRTSRSPFWRRPRRSAAVPGAPEAVTTTGMGRSDMRAVVCPRAGEAEASAEVDAVVCELPQPARLLGFEHRPHRLAHRPTRVGPDLRMREQLQPRERTGAQILVRAARAPVLVRVRAVGGRV